MNCSSLFREHEIAIYKGTDVEILEFLSKYQCIVRSKMKNSKSMLVNTSELKKMR